MALRRRTTVCWHIDLWPEIDRQAWITNTTVGDPFDDPLEANHLRTVSIEKYRKGYGRWLSFLAARGWLDMHVPPVTRVTRDRLAAYFRELRARGNADYTIIGRFAELRMALKILAPKIDTAWVRRPTGSSVYATLEKRKRFFVPPDAFVMFDWAIAMMKEAAARLHESRQQIVYRDGLLLALLSMRARRLRSLSLVRIGHELVFRGARYEIDLTRGQLKAGSTDWFPIPDKLYPYMRTYIETVWPLLTNGKRQDALWVTAAGTPLKETALQAMVFRRTKKRFGQGLGPHRFRHAVSTSAALRDPTNTGLAASVLNISGAVVEEHYNRAGAAQAVYTLNAINERRLVELTGASPYTKART